MGRKMVVIFTEGVLLTPGEATDDIPQPHPGAPEDPSHWVWCLGWEDRPAEWKQMTWNPILYKKAVLP